jgi:hypothetical protein
VVYPTIRVPSHPGKLLMGVFDGGGDYVDGTVLDRRAGEQGAPVPRELFPLVADAEEPEAIYAGPLYFHFGHFLLESLARAWYAHRQPDLPLVWAGAHTWQTQQLKPWQTEILDILGVSNPTRILADPTRYEMLHIPDIGYRYDDWFHPEHAEFLGRYEGPAQVPGDRLWLSRSRLASDARDLNAVPTERRLAEAGWTISHPESLTVREQLERLARAETIAGEEGSAFHTLVLLKDVASKKIEVLRRYGQEHGNLHTVGDARGINQSFHTLRTERVLSAEGRVVSKVTPNSSEVLDLLDVPVAAPRATGTAQPDETAVRRAVEILAPQRLLVVGAADPTLVLASTAAKRVAVSTRFDFDPRAHASSGVDFYELELKSYADIFHGRARFDVIRIAGTDFDSVMAAFVVSKRLARRTTTWLLGSGEVAPRAAVAVRLAHPGFSARRVLSHGKLLYVTRREPGEPRKDSDVGRLSAGEVTSRARRLPVTSLRARRRRQRTGEGQE